MVFYPKYDSRKAGLPPGSLVYLGKNRSEKASIHVIDYDSNHLSEREIVHCADCRGYMNENTVSWINLDGIHDIEKVREFGEVFNIHPLALEDVLSTGQRPKMEDYGDYILFTLKMLYMDDDNSDLVAEHFALILGKGFVLSFQEVEGDVFETIRERLRTGAGRIRNMGADYLAYCLIDAMVDSYFVVLESLGEHVEDVQDEALEKPASSTVAEIHRLRQELIFVRKSAWPLRELLSTMEKSESPLLSRKLKPFLRDVYEHAIQVIDTVESLRDLLSGAMEIHMSSMSNRMNEIMKVLTLISTIFLPLTFITGLYGMNFEHMPELKWHYGYAWAWGCLLLSSIGMAVYFRGRKWV